MPEIVNKHMHVQTKYIHIFHKSKEQPKLHHIHARFDPHPHPKLSTTGGKASSIVEIIENKKHMWKPSPKINHYHEEKPFQIVMDDDYKLNDLNEMTKTSETQHSPVMNEYDAGRQGKFMPHYGYLRPLDYIQKQFFSPNFPQESTAYQEPQYQVESSMYQDTPATNDEYDQVDESKMYVSSSPYLQPYTSQYVSNMQYVPQQYTKQSFSNDIGNMEDSMALGTSQYQLSPVGGNMMGNMKDPSKFLKSDAMFKRDVKKFSTMPRNDKFIKNKNKLYRNSNRRSQQLLKLEGI
jgi:hypothetical protein